MKRNRNSKKCVESSSESETDEQPFKKSPRIRKIGVSQEGSSSSESDIENYLHKPEKLDLNSEFFKTHSNNVEQCDKLGTETLSAITRLSDSDSEGPPIQDLPQQHEEVVFTQFNSFQNYTKKIEEAKKHVEQYQAKKQKLETQTDILHILSVGEGKLVEEHNLTPADLHSSDFESCDSDQEDWEEIENGSQIVKKNLVPKEGLQIVVNLPDNVKKKKGIDLLAAMKRRLNRIRKENQVLVHKVHLLCWLAHGNYVNSVINSTEILATALSLMPSEQSFPSDRTDLTYLGQIVAWFKKAISAPEKSKGKETPTPLEESLLDQMKKKEARDKKMLAIIFVALLRSFGVQARLVMSLQVEPLRPPAHDLHYVGTKNPDKVDESRNKAKNKARPPGVKVTIQKATPVKKTRIVCNKESDKKVTEPKSKIGSAVSKEKPRAPKRRPRSEGSTETGNLKTVKLKSQSPQASKTRLRSKESDATGDQKLKTAKAKSQSPRTSKRRPRSKEIAETSNQHMKAQGKSPQMSKRRPRSKRSSETGDQILKTDSDPTERSKSAEILVSRKSTAKTSSKVALVNAKPQQRAKSTGSPKPSEDKRKVAKGTGKVASTRSTRETTKNSNGKTKPVQQLDGQLDTSESETEMELAQLDGVTDSEAKPNLRKLKPTSKSSLDHLDVKGKRHNLRALTLKHKQNKEYSDSDSEFESSGSVSFKKRLDDAAADMKKLKEIKRRGSQKADVKEIVVGLVKESISKQKLAGRARLANKRKSIDDDDSEESDYVPEPVKKKHHDSDDDFVTKSQTKVKRRVQVKPELRDNSPKRKKYGQDVWVEVFLESEEKWISVDVVSGQVHCVKEIAQRATHPICYVVAWNNNNCLKDVTQRYCPNFNTITRKLRVDRTWWTKSLLPFRGLSTPRDREEDEDLARQQMDQPLPKAISEYKDHPLYALKRHLLKFEAIYPPEPATVGFIRGEAVYPRSCVYTLHSRDIWLKQAKVVKRGEQPYKIVKARPKWDKLSNKVITDQLLEIFGPWQVEDYVPPTAENGIVPKNAFGNVDLFKPCMLPKGCALLKLPGLNKVARRLGIDCASAIIGFDFHGGWSHPVYDGFVVCKEFEEQLAAAWESEQDELDRKEQEKIDKRVYGNWKRLIRGLLIRERLKVKYDFGQPSTSGTTKKDKKKSQSATFCPKKK